MARLFGVYFARNAPDPGAGNIDRRRAAHWSPFVVPPRLFVRSFVMGPLRSNCYFVSAAGQAVVIDPGGDPAPVLAQLPMSRARLSAILLTHLHYDHILGVAALGRATGAPVFASPLDAFLRDAPMGGRGPAGTSPGQGFPPVPAFDFEPLAPGRLTVCGHPVLVLDTPGHTPGGLSFFFPFAGVVFVGDLLFHRSVGRTDWPGGDAATLFASIRERVFSLPDDTEIFPGHGPPTTVGLEKAVNPFFASETGSPAGTGEET